MEIQRAYKVELDPNNEQLTALRCHAGCARWAYNWGLQQKITSFKETGKSPSATELHKELNKLKGVDLADGGVHWMYNVSKCAPQEALRDLDRAFQNFFRRCRKGAGQKGFPKWKSRHNQLHSLSELAGCLIEAGTKLNRYSVAIGRFW